MMRVEIGARAVDLRFYVNGLVVCYHESIHGLGRCGKMLVFSFGVGSGFNRGGGGVFAFPPHFAQSVKSMFGEVAGGEVAGECRRMRSGETVE